MEEDLYFFTESSSSEFSSDDEDLDLVLRGRSRNRKPDEGKGKDDEKKIVNRLTGNLVIKLLNREVSLTI